MGEYDKAESDVVQPVVGWWWTAADEHNGASSCSSFWQVHMTAVGNGR